MNERSKGILVFQLSIILVCLICLIPQFSTEQVKAQLDCGGQPSLKDTNFPKSQAWSPGTTFVVSVFGPTTAAEFDYIKNGVLDWNAYTSTNCSGVSFTVPSTSPRTDPYDSTAPVPSNEVWFIRIGGTQFLPEFRWVGGGQVWEVRAAKVQVQSPWGAAQSWLRRTATHELGHGFGLNEEPSPVAGRSIMGSATQITSCDTDAIKKVYCPATPTPTPTPTPEELVWCLPDTNHFRACVNCEMEMSTCGNWDYNMCACNDNESPVVIDLLSNGFNFTNGPNGVMFDINGDGQLELLSWTAAGSDDSWLALDLDANGEIDNGKELFGNFTLQPNPRLGTKKNGFLALAWYDHPINGGNGDGIISSRDLVFSALRLWQDINHNGRSEPGELSSLDSQGLMELNLDYRESRRTDGNGNTFNYRAKIKGSKVPRLGVWAWDVYLQRGN